MTETQRTGRSAGVRTLAQAVMTTAEAHPERPALLVEGVIHSYDELVERATTVAEAITRSGSSEGSLVAVHGERTFWAYAGILGALLAGRGYVPLGSSFPPERSAAMLARSGAEVLVAAGPDLAAAGAILDRHPGPLTVLAPAQHTSPWSPDLAHRVVTSADLPSSSGWTLPPVDRGDPAYLLFTSGTTGEPKGIGIPHDRVLAYVEATLDRYDIGPDDRCSQNFALTFDLSVHDLFVTWAAGACVCVAPGRSVMAPASFVRDHHLTTWFSTPTTAALMLKLRMLQPGSFPSLRASLFCGEALPASVASAWLEAAPCAVLDNLYGPTEATIACTAYRYSADTGSEELVNGLVPIGRPYGRTRVAVVDQHLVPVAAGESGELLLGGDQLAPGYWRDPDRSSASFVHVPALEPNGPWYRTGDRVSRNEQGDLIYRGRLDDQIKIRGHRVELGEVESMLRRASGAAAVVALGWPKTAAGADGIVAFLAGGSADIEAVLDECRRHLPDYMVPSRVHRVETIPQNASGKADRKRLLAIHEEAT